MDFQVKYLKGQYFAPLKSGKDVYGRGVGRKKNNVKRDVCYVWSYAVRYTSLCMGSRRGPQIYRTMK